MKKSLQEIMARSGAVIPIVLFLLLVSSPIAAETINDKISNQVTVTVAGKQAKPKDKAIVVPISVTNVTGLGFISSQLTIKYDTTQLKIADITTSGTISSSWGKPIYNEKQGELSISHYGIAALTGSGVLMNLVFDVSNSAKAGDLPLDLTLAKFNDGSVPSVLVDGTFKIVPRKINHL